jgi:hypothetical protein
MAGLTALTTIAILLFAGCTAGAAPTAAPSLTPQPTEPTAPVASPAAPVASPTEAIRSVAVKVTFDGETCAYEGPSVLLEATRLNFEFMPTSDEPRETGAVFGGVLPGTTWEEIVDSTKVGRASVNPGWFYEAGYTVQFGPGTNSYIVRSSLFGQALAGHFVGCMTSPSTTDTMYPAALLLVAGP